MSLDLAGVYKPHEDDHELLEALSGSRGRAMPRRLRGLLENGCLELPGPGTGRTWLRFRRLAEIAAEDLSLARLAEGHCDAVSIIAEAGAEPPAPGSLYGVWAAGVPPVLNGSAGGEGLDGERAYCSGTKIIDRGLVTASHPERGRLLLEIDAQGQGVEPVANSWPAIGMADTQSQTLRFVSAAPLRQIGPPGFYEERPGFWNGSSSVAACWYGGALGLVRGLGEQADSATWRLVRAGDAAVLMTQMRLSLEATAAEIDAEPEYPLQRRELRAMLARDIVYRGCLAVIEAVSELGGTRGSTRDLAQARRLADLPVYLRQHHPSQDRERIGRLIECLNSGPRGHERNA